MSDGGRAASRNANQLRVRLRPVTERWVNVSHILAALPVGLEPLASGTWNVFFGPIHLGWPDERDYRIHDHRGRSQREGDLSPIR